MDLCYPYWYVADSMLACVRYVSIYADLCYSPQKSMLAWMEYTYVALFGNLLILCCPVLGL